MMSRGIATPSWLRRYPVSIGCEISVLISMTSPRRAFAGTLTSAFATLRILQACGQGHDDVRAIGPERAVRELADRDHGLRVGQPDARLNGGAARARPEVKA